MKNLTTEMKNKQQEEAISRIKKLNLHPNAIHEFVEEGKLNLSERGMLFWLNNEEQEMVKAWQEETDNLVYHVIKNNFIEIGLCYSFLYVSKYEEEWEMENEDLEELTPCVYVKNMDEDLFSEYGSIGIKSFMGGVIKTA